MSLLEQVLESYHGGLELSILTLVLTFVLELFSLDTVYGVWRQQQKQVGGSGGGLFSYSLYCTAWGLNIWNHFVLGIPVYMVAVGLFCRKDDDRREEDEDTSFALRRGRVSLLIDWVVPVLAIILTHDILYWYGHKTLHRPEFYRFHKFHHSFHTHVPPSSANAVSFVEYLSVYVFPFAMGCALFRPTEDQLKAAISLVSIANLLIHTPKFEQLSQKIAPWWLVSTHDHLEHHAKLTVNYAAPVFHIDRLLESISATWVSSCRKFSNSSLLTTDCSSKKSI